MTTHFEAIVPTESMPDGGLTKREYFILSIYKELISKEFKPKDDVDYLARLSIGLADNLIMKINDMDFETTTKFIKKEKQKRKI